MDVFENNLLESKNEELHEKLTPYLFEAEGLGMILQHPLVFSVPHHSMMNNMLNKQYVYKTNACKKALESENYGSYIFMHERPFRIQAFQDVMHKMDNFNYWDILGDIYVDSENIYQNLKDWISLLKSDLTEKEAFMDKEEREKLEELPDILTIYRGYRHGKSKFGLSWTIDKKIGHFFANRLARDGDDIQVAEYKIKKEDVFAYKTCRNESEIIVLDAENKVFK